MNDATRQLIIESKICAGVLGRGEDFILIRLNDGEPLDQALVEDVVARGYRYVGVLGLKDGRPLVQLAPENPEAVYTMSFAALAWVHSIAEHLRPQPQPQGDGVAWLEALHQLPDTREAL
jgi:hypothetical protein